MKHARLFSRLVLVLVMPLMTAAREPVCGTRAPVSRLVLVFVECRSL